MCGRICVAAEQEGINWLFGFNGQLPGLHPMPARYNIAPTQPILTILGVEERREARLMKWAFMPSWVKDPKSFSLIHNARCETIEEKPSFKNAIKQRRCLIPVSGFYEWKRNRADGYKQPFWFHPSKDYGGHKLMALAGIWETWIGPNGEEVDTTAILTIASNQTMGQIHHRMPVIVEPNHFDDWLDTRSGRLDAARPLMRPAAEDYLSIIPISDRVNQVKNDDISLTEAVEEKSDMLSSDRQPVGKQSGPNDQLTLF